MDIYDSLISLSSWQIIALLVLMIMIGLSILVLAIKGFIKIVDSLITPKK